MTKGKLPNDRQRRLEAARAKNNALHGPPITFKRSRSSITSKSNKKQKHPNNNNNNNNNNHVPFHRCTNVSHRYTKIDRIGEGTYGIVYRARDNQTNNIVALKRCLPHHESSDGFPLTTLREITILRELAMCRRRHDGEGIVELLDVAVSEVREGVFLVFEYCEHDLADLIDSHYYKTSSSSSSSRGGGQSPFKLSEVKQLSIQLLSAVSFLHSRNVLHRDIKLSNLLYNHRGELRLADFGLARKVGGAAFRDRLLDGGKKKGKEKVGFFLIGGGQGEKKKSRDDLTPNVVSLWYRPPELLLGSELYDEGVDNWGVGCVIGELLLGVPLLKGKNELDQIQQMFDLLGTPDSEIWPELYDLPLIRDGEVEVGRRRGKMDDEMLKRRFGGMLSGCGLELMKNLLAYDYHRRWTANEALKSRWFVELPKPTNKALMPTFPTRHGK